MCPRDSFSECTGDYDNIRAILNAVQKDTSVSVPEIESRSTFLAVSNRIIVLRTVECHFCTETNAVTNWVAKWQNTALEWRTEPGALLMNVLSACLYLFPPDYRNAVTLTGCFFSGVVTCARDWETTPPPPSHPALRDARQINSPAHLSGTDSRI